MQLVVASAVFKFLLKKARSGDSPDTKVYPLRQRFRFQTVVVGLKNHDPIFDRLIKTKEGQILDKIGVLSASLVKVPKLFLNNHRW